MSFQGSTKAFRDSIQSTGEVQYTMNTDLKSLVRLSQAAKELEEAFGLELLDGPAPDYESKLLGVSMR